MAALLALGPRDPGTAGASRAADHLAARLTTYGIPCAIDAFTNATPAGDIVFRNVLGWLGDGRRPGTADSTEPTADAILARASAAPAPIVLVSHYDTKTGISSTFAGANDGGSSTGLLLELARAWRAAEDAGGAAAPVLVAFVDGEECRVAYGPRDGLHGSRRLAGQLAARMRPEQAAGVVVLDMVGDRDLGIAIPSNGSSSLVSAVFAAAREAGTRRLFSLAGRRVLDDHVPFLEAGFRAVDLIDFAYGSAPGHNDYWHTDADTLDKLSADSLDAVGRTVLVLVERLRGPVSSGSPVRVRPHRR